MKSIKKSYNYKLTLNAIFFLLLSTGNRLPSGSGSASPSIQIRIRIKTNADPLHCSNVSCNLLLATNTAGKEYIQYRLDMPKYLNAVGDLGILYMKDFPLTYQLYTTVQSGS